MICSSVLRLSTPHTRTRYSRRKGAVIPLVAVVILALVVIGGIAFDSARLQLVKSELRAASDCIARSAANELTLTDSKDKARTKAKEIAKKFQVGNRAFSIRDADVVFGQMNDSEFIPNAVPPNAVQVDAKCNTGSQHGAITMAFGSMFGVKSGSVVSSATAGFLTVDICFVLDRSSSMKFDISENAGGMSSSDPRFMSPPRSSSRWQALDRAVDEFIDQLDTSTVTTQIGIVTYGSDFTFGGFTWPATSVNLPLTKKISSATTQMTNLSNSIWNGNTYIEAGMRTGIDTLMYSAGARVNAAKVMIVLTDGIQNEGECRNAATDAVALGITIHTISFGDFANKQTMIDVAQIGLGTYAHADDEATLKQIMNALASNVTSLIQ